MAKKENESVQAILHADAGEGLQSEKPVVDESKGVAVDALGIRPEYQDPRLKSANLRPKSEDPNKPPMFAPLPVLTKSVEQVYGPDVETVTMIFPRAVTIVNKAKIKINFAAGTQEVPVVDQDNWYLEANGVTLYPKPKSKD